MEKYVKKLPTSVDACQFKGTEKSFKEIRDWVGETFYYDYQEYPRVFLKSLGVHIGDWIVCEDGDFKVLDDERFNIKYRKA